MTRFASFALLMLSLTFGAPPVCAQDAHRAQLAATFRATLAEISSETRGGLGARIVDLTTGETFGVNDTLTFPQGSAIKIPILLELFRQADVKMVSLADQLPMRAADQAGGSGVAGSFGDGMSSMALHDLAVLMIVLSDNTATNMLIDKLGMARVNSTMASLALDGIRLQRKMIRPADSFAGRENLATPAQAAELMARIDRCDVPMSKASCAALRAILEIPKGGPILASVPNGVAVAWKPGDFEGASTAWGVVNLPGRPYVVVAMVNYADQGPAREAIRKVADATYAYMHVLARSTRFGARVPLGIAQPARTP